MESSEKLAMNPKRRFLSYFCENTYRIYYSRDLFWVLWCWAGFNRSPFPSAWCNRNYKPVWVWITYAKVRYLETAGRKQHPPEQMRCCWTCWQSRSIHRPGNENFLQYAVTKNTFYSLIWSRALVSTGMMLINEQLIWKTCSHLKVSCEADLVLDTEKHPPAGGEVSVDSSAKELRKVLTHRSQKTVCSHVVFWQDDFLSV